MSAYFLCENGISARIAETLEENNISLLDIKVQKEDALIKLWNKNSSKIVNVIKATDEFYNNHSDKYVSCFILLKYGLSKGNCELLHSKNVDVSMIKNATLEELMRKYKFTKTIATRIIEAINLYKEDSADENKNTKNKLENILRQLCGHEPISFINLKNIISSDYNYPLENLTKDIEFLKNERKIEFSMNGISLLCPRLLKYIEENFKGKTIEILMARLSGKTLEEIGNKYNLTRERIRQIVAKKMNKFPKLYEDKYKESFEKYDWSCEDFMNFYEEDEYTFNYLKQKYNSGVEDITQLIYEEELSDKQLKKIDKICEIENIMGEKIRPTRNEILKIIVKKFAQDEILIDELATIFNNYIKTELPEHNIELFESRALEGVLSRLNIAVFGFGRKVRYYNYDELSDNDISELKNIILLNDGFYSTKYLFDEYYKMMTSLDIRNEYELHNILKWRIDDKENNVEFIRMPNFIVEYKDKKDFFVDKITELSPIAFNDFVDMLEKDYGHKKNTMASYITVNFKNRIKNSMIEVSYVELKDSEIESLKNKVIEDIYTIKELKNIFKDFGYENASELINYYNISRLGFSIRSNYIIRNNINSVEEYVYSCIDGEDFFDIEDKPYFKNQIFNSALAKFERNFDLVKISDFEYITFNKLKKLNITKESLEEIRKKAKEFLKKEKYISASNLRDVMEDSIIDQYGFDNVFYESIISTIDDAKVLRINNYKLFSILEKHLNRGSFIFHMIVENGSVQIDKLSELIKEKYDINIPYYKIRDYVSGTDLYYNNILEKIYIDKKEFYEEVYCNE